MTVLFTVFVGLVVLGACNGIEHQSNHPAYGRFDLNAPPVSSPSDWQYFDGSDIPEASSAAQSAASLVSESPRTSNNPVCVILNSMDHHPAGSSSNRQNAQVSSQHLSFSTQHSVTERLTHWQPFSQHQQTDRTALPSTKSQNQIGMFEFEFNAGVFRIPVLFRTSLNEAKLKFLITTMMTGDRLYIDATDPDRAYRNVENWLIYGDVGGDLQRHINRIMFSNRLSWLQFWGHKAQVNLESKAMKVEVALNVERSEAHFLLFMYYVNMITSIIIEPSQTQKDTGGMIRFAVDNFAGWVQELELLKIKSNGKGQFKRVKMKTYVHVWRTVERWATSDQATDQEISEDLARISSILFVNNNSSQQFKRFFNFVFCNSFIRMNKRLESHAKPPSFE